MTKQKKDSIDFTDWFSKSYIFQKEYDSVTEAIHHIIRNYKFRIKKDKSDSNKMDLLAIRGSKVASLFLPFNKFGRRLGLNVKVVSEEDGVRVNLKMSPYMELMDEAEVSGFTQGYLEKIIDDYSTAKNLFNIGKELHVRCFYQYFNV